MEILSVPYCKDLVAANVYNFAEMNGLKVLDLSYDANYIRVYAAYHALPFYQQIEARAKTLRVPSTWLATLIFGKTRGIALISFIQESNT